MTDYEAVILDVDGTIVRGETILPGAIDGIEALEDAGCDRVLFSNNPTRDGSHYRETLAPHGIDVDPASVFTSASVSAGHLAENHPDDRVYLVGSERLEAILEAVDVSLTADPDAAEVVLGSFDSSFSYGTLWESLRALDGGVPYYGTDPDTTIPVEDGSIPGSGSILAAMSAVAGREPDAILGKPSAVAAEAALDRLDAAPSRTLVVGDRLDTDVALGERAGMDTALVLTGATDRSDLDASPIEPTHVLESLAAVETLD